MKFRFCGIPIIILLTGMLFIVSCGTYSNLKKSTEKKVLEYWSPDNDLRKTVFIARLNNYVSAAKQDLGTIIDEKYVEKISREDGLNLLVFGNNESDVSREINSLFQKSSDVSEILSLIKIGKSHGIPVVVSSMFSSVAIRQQDLGLLWFRKKYPIAIISATTEIYDTETGAKYLDETFNREIKLSEEDVDKIRKGEISAVNSVEKAINEIIEQMGNNIYKSIMQQPWKAFVNSVSENSLILSCGSRAGLSIGRVLQVYGPNQKIQGNEGQYFLLPGKKIGTIKITNVTLDNSEAIGITGNGFQIDNVIRTK
jgi:hypothetical protein